MGQFDTWWSRRIEVLMTQNDKPVFWRAVALAMLALAFVAVFELYQLRVATERWGLSGGGGVETSVAVLESPLLEVVEELRRLRAALGSRGSQTSVTQGVARDSSPVTVDPSPRPPEASSERRAPLATTPAPDWNERLEAVARTLERADQTPAVRLASLPAEGAAPPPMRGSAVVAAISSLQSAPKSASTYLLMPPAALLRRFGKPTKFSLGAGNELGKIRWSYELPGDDAWLSFELYGGRVVEVDFNR